MFACDASPFVLKKGKGVDIVDAMRLHHSQSNATQHNENQHKGPEPNA
jgi:hypothetical protein